MAQVRAIVLAAGKGTRMRSDLPKVLHPVCGQPMVDHVLDIAKAISSLIYVVVGYQAQKLCCHLGHRVKVVHQKKLLGTADAIRVVLPELKNYSGDVLIVCADTPLLKKESVKRLLTMHRKQRAACTILTAIVPSAVQYGRIVRDNKGQVIAIREEKDASPKEKDIREINTGVYCFRAKDLSLGLSRISLNKKKKEYYLTDIVAILKGDGKAIAASRLSDAREGLGINTRKDLSAADAIMRQRILEKLMADGVSIVDPSTTYIDAGVRIGRDSVIRPCTVIEKDVVIGKRCAIGPFCHVRPRTRIKDDAQVGNFAEISRSTLGAKSLMKHFSFIGDAAIGKNVNIGAGVVTANYDGKNKNKTTIANGAFIGSDSILVAPVSIGASALTGAGCVVTKGQRIPKGQVVVGVPGKIIKRKKAL